MSKEFNEALQSGLDLIRGGGETIDSVVARYPEFAEDLRAQLEVAVWLASSQALLDPSPEFVSSSKRRLINKIKQEQQAAAVPKTWGERIQEFFTVQKLAPVGFVVVLMLGLVVSGTVVSASQKSVKGDTLYAVKRTLEQIALATSLEEQNDAVLQIKFLENRFTEVKALIIEGRVEEASETLKDAQEQVDDTIKMIENISDQDNFLALGLAQQLDDLLAEQSSYIEALTQTSPLFAGVRKQVDDIAFVVNLTAKQLEEFAIFLPPTPTPSRTPLPTRAPTETPLPTPSPAPTYVLPSSTPTTKPTKEPTNTPLPPTSTPVPPTATPVPPTNTPKPDPTDTPTPTNTPTATPTNTPTNTPSPTNTPTNTPSPTNTPTNTPSPTNTPTKTPTNTPITPTLTPTPQTNSNSTETPNP